MIDNEGPRLTAICLAEFLGQQCERSTVLPARNRHRQARPRPERPQPVECRIKPIYWQFALLLTASMRGCIPAGGVGNWLLSELSVEQASSLAPMPASEEASPSKACGA